MIGRLRLINLFTPLFLVYIGIVLLVPGVGFSDDAFPVPETAEITLAWDPVEPAPDGYRLYERKAGQSYDYNQPCWTGTNNSGTVYNLEWDTNYSFVVRAYVGDQESANSNEVTFVTQSPPTTAYTITVVTSGNGSILPGNTVTVDSGANQTFTISPDSGFHVSDVKVDGNSVGTPSSYSFNQVSANHTLDVGFAINTHQIAASAGENGTITPAGNTTVDNGATKTYAIAPNAGCRIADVSVDGVSIGAVATYTFNTVTGDHTISAVFEVNTYTISVMSDGNGTVSPDGATSVPHGESRTFTFTPVPGFHVSDVLVDNQSAGAMGTYTFTGLNGDHTLSVGFSENSLVSIWIEAEDGDLKWPMEIGDDVNASEGGYIWVPTGNGNLYSLSETAGTAKFHFTVPENGEYVVWGREVSNDTVSDSFFVSMDGKSEIAWHTQSDGQDVWTWDIVSTQDAEVYRLEPGAHTLTVSQREDGTKLDKILITNDLELIPDEPESIINAIEFGEVVINHNWIRVSFDKSFTHPVVVAGPPSFNGNHPVSVRIRNVDETGFDIRIQEWDYLDGKHVEETISYLVMEKGNYTLSDGTRIKAGITTGQAGFKQVVFNELFNVCPVVMTSITSFDDETPVTGRIWDVTVDGFQYQLQEQEANTQDHGVEKITYIAWEPSVGMLGEKTYLIQKTADTVKNNYQTICFENDQLSTPTFLAAMQTRDGGDTANVRYTNKTKLSVDVQIDEEESKNKETNHTTEVVGYMLFSERGLAN